LDPLSSRTRIIFFVGTFLLLWMDSAIITAATAVTLGKASSSQCVVLLFTKIFIFTNFIAFAKLVAVAYFIAFAQLIAFAKGLAFAKGIAIAVVVPITKV